MRVVLADDAIEVRLARWEKVLGLLGDIVVPLSDVSAACVVDDPIAVAMGSGTKVGLRLPWFYYVARSIRLDRAFIVRRRLPGLSFAVSNAGSLKEVLVSTPDAADIAARLGGLTDGPVALLAGGFGVAEPSERPQGEQGDEGERGQEGEQRVARDP